MKRFILGFFLSFFPFALASQLTSYRISFPNAVHHEALVEVQFTGVGPDTLEVRMSRSSPGRYALHEFAKNVYGLEAFDLQGNPLNIFRTDPYSWHIHGHQGTVKVRYTLYADRGDGTYSQIDETHAHLNIPATFLYAPSMAENEIRVTFEPREDLNWKIATQLPALDGYTYMAPNLQYFMDSPVELSDFGLREFEVPSAKGSLTIRLALHQEGSEAALDEYFEMVKKVVLAQKEVFGELPGFDYGNYTFLACYMPQVSGDGMEHRNSTVLTSTQALESGGMDSNIGTVSHEFFHAWNVERLRPASLEPFNFERANMSGALWFAEGFTSYYTRLMLCRAGIISPEEYVSGLSGTFNYVWNHPGRRFHSPTSMSYQAPFVDAATSIDPENTINTFISYYSYGSVLGLALDLSLRRQGLSLDGYMQLLWERYGRDEKPYTLQDLELSLVAYAGKNLGNSFFEQYIHNSEMPDYPALFETVGLVLDPEPEDAYLGISGATNDDGSTTMGNNAIIGSPAYEAGLERGDVVIKINGKSLTREENLDEQLREFMPGDSVTLDFIRRGHRRTTKAILAANPAFTIKLLEQAGSTPAANTLQAREAWLKSE